MPNMLDKGRKNNSRRLKQRWKNEDYRNEMIQLLNACQKEFTDLEKKVFPLLSKTFNTENLRRERIENIFFDFVDNEYIIEFTVDNTRGINRAINRFGILNSNSNENRICILVCPSYGFGSKRKKRLDYSKAIHKPIFWNNGFTFDEKLFYGG